jgi:hypothetical protein
MWNITSNLVIQFFKQKLNDEGDNYVRPKFVGVSYPLDTIIFCNKCDLISTCQSYEKVANLGKGSSYRVFNNAIQIVLSEHTSLIEIFCLVLDVDNLVSLAMITTPKMA